MFLIKLKFSKQKESTKNTTKYSRIQSKFSLGYW